MPPHNLPGISKTPPERARVIPRRPTVVLQPKTHARLRLGINLIVNAVRPTLGPLPRLVLMERLRRTDLPEFLDDAATIARRIIEVQPRGSDVGAMLVRSALWKMQREVGDGSATMAVMYQVIFNEAIRYISVAGANAMLLRSGLEKGLAAVQAQLAPEPLSHMTKDQIADLARAMCQDDNELAGMLGEVFDIVGTDGLIVVEKWNRAGLEREYIDGTYWHLSGWFSRHFITDPAKAQTMYEDAALLISDLAITEPEQLVPVLHKCVQAGVKRLVIIARELSDRPVGLLVNNNRAKTIESMVVRTPKVAEMDRVAAMEDISLLTGGRIFYSAAGDTFDHFEVSDLGHARRAWATESLFGLFGGKGDPRQVRQHMVRLRAMLAQETEDHPRRNLQQRLGRMSGGTAILRVGGLTESEIVTRHALAERTVTNLRHALMSGVAPGGGAALLAAATALQGLAADNDDEALAYKILARALEEPMRAIVQNAGGQPDVILEKVKERGPGFGYDGRARKIVDMRQAGILDSVLMLRRALEIAVSGAALAVTTDVIVHHAEPKESVEP